MCFRLPAMAVMCERSDTTVYGILLLVCLLCLPAVAGLGGLYHLHLVQLQPADAVWVPVFALAATLALPLGAMYARALRVRCHQSEALFGADAVHVLQSAARVTWAGAVTRLLRSLIYASAHAALSWPWRLWQSWSHACPCLRLPSQGECPLRATRSSQCPVRSWLKLAARITLGGTGQEESNSVELGPAMFLKRSC